MKTYRVKAILKQEYFITRRSIEIMFDIFFMPVMSIVVFGFLSAYLAGFGNPQIASSLLFGMILWQAIFIIQYSVAVGSLWNIWSRNLSTMFVAPLSVVEYIFAHTLSGIFKALFIILFSSVLSYFIFGFNIMQVGFFNLAVIFVLFSMFAFSLGVIILGLIFRFGTKIQALAWGTLFILQPLTAVFYPVSVLPPVFQAISYAMPATYVFEAARNLLLTGQMNWSALGISLLLNIVYVIFSLWFFNKMFFGSRVSGQFARNES